MSETCQRCKSTRVASYGAKTSDMNHISLGEKEHNGYMPGDFGIGGGDYVEFEFCLDCGQLKGEFPLPKTELEEFDSPEQYIEKVLSSANPFDHSAFDGEFEKLSPDGQDRVRRMFDRDGLKRLVEQRKAGLR